MTYQNWKITNSNSSPSHISFAGYPLFKTNEYSCPTSNECILQLLAPLNSCMPKNPPEKTSKILAPAIEMFCNLFSRAIFWEWRPCLHLPPPWWVGTLGLRWIPLLLKKCWEANDKPFNWSSLHVVLKLTVVVVVVVIPKKMPTPFQALACYFLESPMRAQRKGKKMVSIHLPTSILICSVAGAYIAPPISSGNKHVCKQAGTTWPKRAHSDATFHRNAFLMMLMLMPFTRICLLLRQKKPPLDHHHHRIACQLDCWVGGMGGGSPRWHWGDSLHINHIHILYNSFSASFGGPRSRRDLCSVAAVDVISGRVKGSCAQMENCTIPRGGWTRKKEISWNRPAPANRKGRTPSGEKKMFARISRNEKEMRDAWYALHNYNHQLQSVCALWAQYPHRRRPTVFTRNPLGAIALRENASCTWLWVEALNDAKAWNGGGGQKKRKT